MKEFIDKLTERLREESYFARPRGMETETVVEIGTAISIVNELAEEYKVSEMPKGWIPCERELPELTEGTECFKQSKCCLVTLKWWDGDMTESIGWYNQSGVWNEDSKNCKVVAWMPLPAPYTEGE